MVSLHLLLPGMHTLEHNFISEQKLKTHVQKETSQLLSLIQNKNLNHMFRKRHLSSFPFLPKHMFRKRHLSSSLKQIKIMIISHHPRCTG